jgi:arylsulfatase A-like enzyme
MDRAQPAGSARRRLRGQRTFVMTDAARNADCYSIEPHGKFSGVITRAKKVTLGVIGVLACVMAVSACSRSGRPNVLVILVDTLRADRLGCYGNASGLTPFMDRFADGATVFRHAYATSSWTAPSVASLFTARYPSQHGVVSVFTKLRAQELTLPEQLAQAGYKTGAVVANFVVTERMGYNQGFEFFGSVEGDASVVRARALQWLDSVHTDAPGPPVMLYLHFMDPHWPYTPPQEYVDRLIQPGFDATAEMSKMARKLNQAFTEQYVTGATTAHRQFTCADIELLEKLYDAEVAALDAQLAQLFAELESRHFLDNTVVVLLSDHGEELFEHGSLWHAYTLYEESIRVPLIVKLPGQTSGRVVERPVSLLDVAPSVLRVVGIDIPPAFLGTPFVDLLGGYWWPAVRERWRHWRSAASIFSELEGETDIQPQRHAHSAALIERAHKLLLRAHGDPEVYDLSRDPHEEKRLDAAGSPPGPELVAHLRALQGVITPIDPRRETDVDQATLERLNALGYGLAENKEEAPTHAAAAPATPPATSTDESPTRRDLCEPTAQPATPAPAVGRSYF